MDIGKLSGFAAGGLGLGLVLGQVSGLSGQAVGEAYVAVGPTKTTQFAGQLTREAWRSCADDGGVFRIDPAHDPPTLWCADGAPENRPYASFPYIAQPPTSGAGHAPTPLMAKMHPDAWATCAEANGQFVAEPWENDVLIQCYTPAPLFEVGSVVLTARWAQLEEAVTFTNAFEGLARGDDLVVERVFSGPDALYEWRQDVEESGTPKPKKLLFADTANDREIEILATPIRWEMPFVHVENSEPGTERITFVVAQVME